MDFHFGHADQEPTHLMLPKFSARFGNYFKPAFNVELGGKCPRENILSSLKFSLNFLKTFMDVQLSPIALVH